MISMLIYFPKLQIISQRKLPDQMGFHYFCFISLATLVFPVSSLIVNPQLQGCSLMGIDLQHCLAPSAEIPFSIDSCCSSLNQAIQAGYYCLCSLLGPSTFPVFSTELQLSFSNCYISMPSLTHCNGLGPQPFGLAPPVAAVPGQDQPPPAVLPPPPPPPSLLVPPDLPKDEIFVPLPPKVNEIPINSRENSSIVDSNSTLSSNPLPKLSIPERWDYGSSDAAKTNVLMISRNLLIVALYSCSIV